MDARYEWILIVLFGLGLLGVVVLFATGYIQAGVPCDGIQTYEIRYLDNATGSMTTAVATKLANGSYQVGTRTLGPADKVEVLRLLEGGAVCQCDCCPEQRKPCVEPIPKERYLCANKTVVKDRSECDSQCNVTVVSKIFVCGNGKEVEDPQECGGVSEIIYYCANGNVVPTPDECGCSSATAAACVPAVVEKKYKCSDGSVVLDASQCGGEVTTYYICSDQRKVAERADCFSTCPSTVYPVTAVTNVPPSGVSVVYECWNGAIVNSKGDCPLYCDKKCECPDYEKPVCGADGKTYRNRCLLGCAGVKYVSDGECPTYNCIAQGQLCQPPTLTANVANQSYCCPGYQCIASSAVPVGGAATNVQQVYTCQPVCSPLQGPCRQSSECCRGLVCNQNTGTCQLNCSQMGSACTSNSTCCSGYCNPITAKCDNAPQCVNESMPCRSVTTGAAIIEKTCCSGLYCSPKNICEKIPPCASSGVSCKQDSECCSQYCDPVTYKCSVRPSCYENYYPCNTNSDCCSGYCEAERKKCMKIPDCDDSCSNGVRKFNCEFDVSKGKCVCESEACPSQRCNEAGTDCASSAVGAK